MMAKRKRLTPVRFDVPPSSAPEVKSALPRSPMVARPPIADVAQDAAVTAAFSEVAQEMQAARAQERLIQRLPLTAVVADYLMRDRAEMDHEELQVLASSMASRGQQTAVEVTELGNGLYGLISGFRRLAALQLLSLNDPAIDSVLAIVRHPANAAAAYRAMVEENEIRVGLSFYERGRIVARAMDQGVFRTDRAALQELFAAVPRARRSKIGSFVTVVRALDEVLRFPTTMTEKQGLMLAKSLDEDAELAQRLTDALMVAERPDAAAEWDVIMDALNGKADAEPHLTTPAPGERAGAAGMDFETNSDAGLETEPATSVTRQATGAVPLQNGLILTIGADGQVTLRGARLLDPAFVARLETLLRSLD